MRITDIEKQTIINAVNTVDPFAKIYLFGSRVDETKKGGDIDILIFSNDITYGDKLKIKAYIFEKIDEQKIDLIVASNPKDPFVAMILEKGELLK